MRRAFLTIFACLQVAGLAPSQTFRGGISGSVADSTGAAIPEATVRVTNSATLLPYSTVSSSSGGFSLQDLPLEDYTIDVAKPRLSKFARECGSCLCWTGLQPASKA